MDSVATIQRHLEVWATGGEVACRELLTRLHCNNSNGDKLDELVTVYQTLLTGTLSTWSSTTLSSATFVTFVQTVLAGFPSSSGSSAKSADALILGEALVDMIWSIDIELDEIVAEAKAAESSKDKDKELNDGPPQEVYTRQNGESDKDTLADIVKQLLVAGIIQPALCRERLDSALLASVDLIMDKLYMDKKEVRTRTSLFYKQNKVNLLREQSEGYSKLATELTSNVGPPHSPATGRSIESLLSIHARARQVWERVVSLIGHFDLDPNRALDILLDVFSTHLATHYTFFLSLLSYSPWAPTKSPHDGTDVGCESNDKSKDLDEVLLMAELWSNKKLQSDANRGAGVLAQVLGFKFVHYQHPDITETTPMSLHLLAAVLIREGFITLEDIFPHLAPDEEGMEKTRKDYLAQVDARITGAKISQLAMAAPLESATAPTAKSKTPSTPKPSESRNRSNQKVGIVSALLSLGALRPALFVLTKYPWMIDANPQIADLMIRILKHSISSLYESTPVTKERISGFTQPRARYGAGGIQTAPLRKPHLTFWAPTPPSTSVLDFVFFFPDWSERIPVCSTMSDLLDVVEPLMRFIGVHISRDPLFITKLLRLGRHQLATTVPTDPETKKQTGLPDPDNPIRQFWLKILRLYMLPALCLIRGNAVCTVEVWNMIRQYDTTIRWRLYGEWKTKVYKSHHELRVRAVQVNRESKGILRRLSHNTIDSLAGPVAKLVHSNPCIFFANAVNQIMAYDNLATVVIQVLKYSTNMSFDVLVFVILDALANPNKERVKDDGVNTADWLQSLASFTGMLFRRYSADLSPVIKYIVHQLYNGQTTEIIVLRELIWKMAGIEPLPSLSESQISAMAGGPTLRIEAVASSTRGARLDPGDVILKAPQRLGKALIDSSLALPLLIQVAQQRQSCAFTARDAHLKSLASLYDTTHGVLLQYLELITSPDIILPEDYAKKILPTLADLGELYGISPSICMQIIRPKLNEALMNAALAMQEQERLAGEEAERRLKAALTAKREPSASASRVASPIRTVVGTAPEPSQDLKQIADPKQALELKPLVEDAVPSDDVVMESVDATLPLQSVDNPWLPELSALFDDVKKIAPASAMELIGAGFYLTFWQLSTYDLSPPAAKYDEEGSTLRTLSRQEDSKYSTADRSSDRAKRLTATSHRQKRDRYNTFVQKLAKEFKDQTAARVFTMKRLAREKHHWFANNPKALINALIEHCFQPRCLLSPMDADFCAQFVRVMHFHGTPGFWTLTCYDRLLGDHVKNIVFSCSEYEAKNYGRFLLGILSDLLKWHQDEQLYLQENRTKSGGKAAYLPGLQLRWTNKPTVSIGDLAKWSEIQQFNRKCHRKLAKCLTDCIETGEFMHVYNSIIVLKEILPVFPVAAASGTAGYSLVTVIDRLLETEERGDLKILTRAYAASLKKRESVWAMSPDQPLSKAPPTQPAAKATVSEKPSTPVAPRAAVNNGNTGEHARNSAQSSTNPPSAPRAHLSTTSNGVSPAYSKPSTPTNQTKLAMESIPRPDYVKRVRPDIMITDTAETSELKPIPNAPTENLPSPSGPKESMLAPGKPTTNAQVRTGSPLLASSDIRKDLAHVKDTSRPQTPTNAPSPVSVKEPPRSPRSHRGFETGLDSPQSTMPPPSIPSQKPSAQELRETAKLTMGSRSATSEKVDDKGTSRETNGELTGVRRRSSSPCRPGTRNNSSESRASGGPSRSDLSGDRERSEEKRLDRQEPRAPLSRRESARNERGGRERTAARDGEREKESDRDKDRERERADRHGDRERKDRDRDRERDRDRDRERDRDRNRERDTRDRHRRDDRERKERDTTRNAGTIPTTATVLPSRPDAAPRHRSNQTEEGLGKRRRPADDDPERASKRSSRKETHHDDRSRRSSDATSHERPREPDRRRRDRESDEKPAEKRIPDAPASTAKPLPPTTPSAPRAMASDGPRGGKSEPASTRDRDWKTVPHPPTGPGSLRSRIGEKTTPFQPEAPTSTSLSSKEEDKDSGHRKRTASEREKDTKETPAATEPESGTGTQPSKRPKIIRNRYTAAGNGSGASAFARKTLPLADKGRPERKD